MARKTVLPNAIEAAKPGGALINHFRDRLNENLNDGRENHSPPAYRVGFGGRLMVPGKRGYMYVTQVHPSGGGIVKEVYIPTNEDNTPAMPLEVGQAVAVTRNVGSSPCQWLFGGIASVDSLPTLDVHASSCTPPPPGYVCPPGTSWAYPENTEGTSLHVLQCKYPDGSLVAPVDPWNLQQYLDALQKQKNARDTAGTTTDGVKVVDGWPSVSLNGDIIKLVGEDAQYIYSGAQDAGGWMVLRGPRSGTFTMAYTAIALTAGQLVTFPPGRNEVIPTDNRDISTAGWQDGMVVYNRDAQSYALIQVSGDFPYTHSFSQNKPLYMGTAGGVTDTAPIAGSGCIFQPIGYARNSSTGSNSYITLEIGQAVIRSGTVSITQGDPDEMQITGVTNSTGSTIAAFKAVYFDSGGMKLANSSAGSDFPCKGFTIASVANATTGTVFQFGNLNGFVGLTKGAVYYLDPANPGGITATIPSGSGVKVQVVGVADFDGTTLLVNPDPVPMVL